MEFKEFCNQILGQVKDYLPSKFANAEVNISTIEKNNGVQLQALRIRLPEQNAEPTIYLEGFYQEFQRGGSMKNILKEIAELRVERDIPKQIRVEDLLNFEKIKNNIVFEVVGAEANKERLTEIPHQKIHDMAYTYRIMIGQIGENANATIQITNKIMKEWGVNKGTLHNLAIKNTPQILVPKFSSMEETLKGLFANDPYSAADPEIQEFMEFLNSPEEGRVPMYVLTNKTNVKGAAALFYPGMKEWIGEQVAGDYFVLPSSLHEVIIVPDNGEMDVFELKDMVQEVNNTQVLPDEVLTNEVYFYDRESGQLCKATEKEKAKNKVAEHGKEKAQKAVQSQKKKQKPVKKDKGISIER